MAIFIARTALFALIAAMSVVAHRPARAEAAMGAESIRPTDIVAVASGDFDGNGTMDAAMIVLPQDENAADSDLYILLEGADPDAPPGKLGVALVVRAAVWGPRPLMGGQVPGLTALPNGSLRVESQNTGIGRNAWQNAVTLAFRNGRFRVAGFTHQSYDRLQEEPPVACDLNLFAGKGVLNDEPFAFAPSQAPFETWDQRSGFDLCKAD